MQKKMTGIIAAALLAASMSAMAAQTNNGCQGNCPSGGDTVNQGGNGYGQGGNGYGGAGGSAVAGAVGIGIAAGGAGGSGGSGGAGGSGGQGGAGGSVLGSGNSSAAGGAVVGSGNSSNANQSSAAGNTTSVSVAGDTVSYRAAASTAYAPPIAPTALCMGSSSAGGTGMTFGFSIGTSWTDSNCMRLEQVRTVATVLKDPETAAAMMCAVDAYREAREKIGKPC